LQMLGVSMVTWSSPTLHRMCCRQMMLTAGTQQTHCFHISRPTTQPSQVTKTYTPLSSAQHLLMISNITVELGSPIIITLTRPMLTKELYLTMLFQRMPISSRKEFKTSQIGSLARMVPTILTLTSMTTSKTDCSPDKQHSQSRTPFVY
jgi:hypothetical protein